jgi:CheY-like chemotaxis protein
MAGSTTAEKEKFQSKSAIVTPSGCMKTILVADDEEDLRALLLMTLEDPAYRLVEASDGESALELIHTEHPEIVILDWMMPKKNGIEVARSMQDHPKLKHIPIIMLTAKDQPCDQQQGQEAGVCAYFGKPFSPLQLLDMVQRLIGEASAQSAR